VSLFLVLLNQHGQVLAEAVAVATLAVVAVLTLAGVALPVAVLVPRQLSTVAAFERHRLSGVLILPTEVSVGQVSRLDSIMVLVALLAEVSADCEPRPAPTTVVRAYLLCSRTDSTRQQAAP
jgi:hypothetical protein